MNPGAFFFKLIFIFWETDTLFFFLKYIAQQKLSVGVGSLCPPLSLSLFPKGPPKVSSGILNPGKKKLYVCVCVCVECLVCVDRLCTVLNTKGHLHRFSTGTLLFLRDTFSCDCQPQVKS